MTTNNRAVISEGREVIIGSGDNRVYTTVSRIVDNTVYSWVPGRRRESKFNISQVFVDLGRKGIVPASL